MSLLLLIVIYLSFISLGLPDSIIGAAWPVMHTDLGADIYLAGVIGMVAFGGTILSSLMSAKVISKFDTGKVTLVSVAMTALALLGFSVANKVWQIIALAVIMGLGGGTIDAALNNFVALHYKSRHMSWLHSFWGIGATGGPYIMGICLTAGLSWRMGFRSISYIQIALVVILIFSLPLWKKKSELALNKAENFKVLSIPEALALPGAKAMMTAFFCYCAIEVTTGLWISSYMVFNRSISTDTAAKWASLFYLGITLGRLASGVITEKVGNKNMVRLGQGILVFGIVFFILPFGETASLISLILIGVGCAPIFPSLLHETPINFGAQNSQSVMGIQMASAYIGSTFMPPLFSALAKLTSIALLPFLLLLLAVFMIIMTERVNRIKI